MQQHRVMVQRQDQQVLIVAGRLQAAGQLGSCAPRFGGNDRQQVQADSHLVIMVERLRPVDLPAVDECAIGAAGVPDDETVAGVQLQDGVVP